MIDPRDAEVLGATAPRGRHPRPAAIFPDTATQAQQPSSRAVDLDDAPPPAPRRRRSVRTSAERFRHLAEGMPLRARLVTILVALLALALAVSGVAFLQELRGTLVRQVDTQLRQAAQPVAQAVLHDNRGRGGPFPSNYVVHVSAINGSPAQTIRPVIDSNLPSSNPAFPAFTAEQAKDSNSIPFTLESLDGSTSWRVVALPGYDDVTGNLVGYVFVATPLTQVTAAVVSLRLILLLVVLVVIIAGALLGWLAIRRSFRPLIEVEETAAAIAAGDLSRRIPERPASTEVGRLTGSLNGMLTQIESAFRAREASEARTRRFAADASHELRTPLVSIRGFAELYRQGAVPTDEVPRTMRRIEDEAKRMGSLVEDLLLLARLDAQRPARHEPVDLLVLAGDAVHDARGLDADRTVRLVGLGAHGPEPAVVIGDEDRLRQVVANLVANAVRHTPAGTPIEVAVGQDGHRALIEVRDHGQGLTPEQAQRVFERFYRIDSSRRRDTGGGSGLGLSIVAAVVASHAGEVSVAPTPGGGATFRVSLPAGPADATEHSASGAHGNGLAAGRPPWPNGTPSYPGPPAGSPPPPGPPPGSAPPAGPGASGASDQGRPSSPSRHGTSRTSR